MSIPLRELSDFTAQEIIFYRVFTSIIAVTLIIVFFRRKFFIQDLQYIKTLSKANRFKLAGLVILSALLITGNWFTYIYATNQVSIKSAASAYLVCPLITSFLGYFFLKEKLSTLKIAALSLALLSIIMLATGSFIEMAWAVFIATFYALFVVVLKWIKHIDKFNLLAIQLIISGVCLLPLFFINHLSVPSAPIFWTHISLISIVFTIIPLFLVSYAVQGMPSSTLGILIYVNPVVAFLVALFYFKEAITVYQVTAYLLLLLSIVIFNLELFKKKAH